jgi:putative transcriptional regulator
MSKAANSIRKGLDEAIEYAKGGTSKRAYRVHVPEHVDVKAIRTKLRMTQQAFAARFGFSINTLRHWEQGKREPERTHAGVPACHRPSPKRGSKGTSDRIKSTPRDSPAVGLTSH